MFHPQNRKGRRLLLVPLITLAIPASAQVNADSETEKLQRETQNPVASLISVPIQNNTNFNLGLRIAPRTS